MINFLEEGRKLIAMNSVSASGNEEVAVYVQSLMNTMGFKTSLQHVTHSLEDVSKRQFNVIGILGDPLVDSRTKKGLLFLTHLDTTTPGLSRHWTETGGNPYRLTIKDDKLYGLGAADSKLDLLCKLKACERYRDNKFKMPIYVACTAGAHAGLLGTRFLIKSMSLNPRYVVVGAPTELSIVSRHKAYALYQLSMGYNQLERDAKGFNTRIEIQCYGRTASGSYPHLGENAAQYILSIVKRIKTANFQLRFTKISSGDAYNKVPDTATVEFYIQSSSFEDFKKFYREQLSAEAKDRIQIEFGGLGETGVRFLPDNILDAIEEAQSFFANLKNDILSAQDVTFEPAQSTVNFCSTKQRSGFVDLWFDIHLLPSLSVDEFDRKLKEGIQKLNANYPTLMMSLSRRRFNPTLDVKPESELYRAALEAQRRALCSVSDVRHSVSSEASQFAASGFEVIAFGPGQAVSNSQSPNEHNVVDQLDKAVHFYDGLIERFCL